MIRNLILVILTVATVGCSTVDSAQQTSVYAKPVAFLAAQGVIDKSDLKEDDIRHLASVAKTLIAVAETINSEISKEQMLQIVSNGDPHVRKWIILTEYLYDVYYTKTGSDKVKNTSIVLKSIAEGILDAVKLAVVASK